jgi:hypothetical protein
MASGTIPHLDPVSSGEITTLDMQRYDAIELKQSQVRELLDKHQAEALLIRDPHNFSWFTCGGECRIGPAAEPAAALFISRDARLLVCSNVDSGQFFDHEVSGLGLQLKERPWHEPLSNLIEDLCRGRKMIVDSPLEAGTNCSSELQQLRMCLLPIEQQRQFDLGRDVTHAIEATLRSFKQGETEHEIAGQISHRLIRRGISLVQLQVIGDGRSRRYRHWTSSSGVINQTCTASVIARRHGLHVGAARTLSFGVPKGDLTYNYRNINMVLATACYFSQSDWQLSDVWRKVERIYEKFGAFDAWRNSEQGFVTGYAPHESAVTPHNNLKLQTGMSVCWTPSIMSAVSGHTIQVGNPKIEYLTTVEQWPVLKIAVKQHEVQCPDILIRE